ncbi:CFEM domain-containing protein [Colletotrichum sojae]|uniref:CFEM domain-containing protein n=1 Tax=Colletotrichum sojae TaxID=2175907 RepID=A0A8H6MUL3_9PEZI|nr:CFEM domain-containing protein [Colletotrichum sojae]
MFKRIAASLTCVVAVIAAATPAAPPPNATTPAGAADPAAAAMQQLAASLSPCAINCTTTELAKSTCQPTDFACICANQQLNAGIAACLAQKCTIIESLQALNYSKTSCGAPVHHNTDQLPITWTLLSLSVLAVGARFVSKVPALNPAFPFGWDDWTILASLAALIPADVLSQVLVGLGLGRDVWTVPPDNITMILLLFFVEELFYSTVVATTKLSIVIFYLRLFSEPWFRRACYAMLAITIAYGVGQILAVVLVCMPISYNWTIWDGQHEGKCANTGTMAFSNGGFNIAIDLALFILPVTQFITVSWTLKKKIGVSLIFLVGLFVTVSSGIRLATVAQFSGSQNPTFDFKQLSIWSLIEMHVSVICACMPGMTAFIRRVKPRFHQQRENLPMQERNQPRTGRSIARRIRETMTRITAAARETANSAVVATKKSMKSTSTATGTQPSTFDPEAPEYRDYLTYASYAEGGNKAVQLNDLSSERREGGRAETSIVITQIPEDAVAEEDRRRGPS